MRVFPGLLSDGGQSVQLPRYTPLISKCFRQREALAIECRGPVVFAARARHLAKVTEIGCDAARVLRVATDDKAFEEGLQRALIVAARPRCTADNCERPGGTPLVVHLVEQGETLFGAL